MAILKDLIYIIIILVLLASLYHWYNKEPREVEVVKTETIRDTVTVTVEKTVFAPSELVLDTIYVDSIVTLIDSASCFYEYHTLANKHYAERTYNDTLKNDTSAFVSLQSKVKGNKLTYQKLTYRNNTPTVINALRYKPRLELYVGGELSIDGVQVAVMARTKRRWLFGVGYTPQSRSYSLKAYVPITGKQ